MTTDTPVYAGIGMAEAAAGLYESFNGGTWIDKSLNVAGAGLETLSFAADPMGYLLQAGASWLMEHVPPLRRALDWVGGEPGQIAQYAQAWRIAAQSVTDTSTRFDQEVVRGAASWTGDGSEKYRKSAGVQSDLLKAAAISAKSVATVTSMVGILVGVVRDLVRQLVAECCAELVTIAARGVAATPRLVRLVTSTIPRWMRLITAKAEALTRSITSLGPLLGQLGGMWDRIRTGVSALGRGQGDVPGGTTPSGATTPSQVDLPGDRSPAPQPQAGGGGDAAGGGGGGRIGGNRPPTTGGGGGKPGGGGGRMRPPRPAHPDPSRAYPLGRLDPAKVTRDAKGLITHYDGKPVNDHLQEVARGRAEDIRRRWDADEITRTATGEMSSVGIDRRTGEMFEAINGRSGEIVPPDRVHPLLQERLRELEAGRPYPQYNPGGALKENPRTDWPIGEVHPLQHSEVKVANEMLWQRDPGGRAGKEVLGEFRVDNWEPFAKGGVNQKACCANCSRMLAGVPSQAGNYTGHPNDPATRLIGAP